MVDTSLYEQQLQEILNDYDDFKKNSAFDDLTQVVAIEKEGTALITRCIVAVEQVAGMQSEYYKSAQHILNDQAATHSKLTRIVGITQSLLLNLQRGYLISFEERIHGNVFSDFLERADHLTDTGHKDAGAVIAGSTLEAHLRALATKNNLPISSGARPTKADTLNAELKKAGVYELIDQKNVTAWL